MAAALVVLATFYPAQSRAEDETGAGPSADGVSVTTETHGDWTVFCEAGASGRTCRASQMLGTREGRHAIMAMDVVAEEDGSANALLTLPFGLDLRSGVRLNLDEALAVTVPFSACIEEGCLVSFDIGRQELALFESGETLRLRARTAYAEDDILDLNIPLRGFASALARAGTLAQ